MADIVSAAPGGLYRDKTALRIKHTVYISLGLLCVVLGSIGLFLPLLPTTPFLLLAAFLFAGSSERLHEWLLAHKHLGPYIHAFRGKRGLTRAQKFRIAASFTVLFGVSIYVIPHVAVKLALGFWWLFWVVFIYRTRAAAESVTQKQASAPETPPTLR